MPVCVEVHKAVQEVTGTSNSNSTTHKDISQASLKRDSRDLQTTMDFLAERKPFAKVTELRSISSGIMAEGSVNVVNAKSIGDGVLEKMAGKTVLEHKFSRKQVKTLASSIYASVDGEKIEIDPQQMYQRLLVAGIGTIELTTLFQYELCSYPSSLFDKKLLMRLADKADLQHGIVKKVPGCVITQDPPGVHHVVDGGALLQRIPWPRHASYDDICQLYGNYVQSHYQTATIIFDTYTSGPSTKDEAHQRRSGSEMCVNVQFKRDMQFSMKKKPFLANTSNKQEFLNLLGTELDKLPGISVQHAAGDADYDISMCACHIAQTKPVVVVAEDTDVFHSPATPLHTRQPPYHLHADRH